MENFKHKFKIADKTFHDIPLEELEVHPEIKENRLTFSITVPKYLYDRVNETGEQFHSEDGKNTKWNFKKKFTNKITGDTLGDIFNKMEHISKESIQVQDIIDSEKVKKIAVKFTQSDLKEVSSWNHATLGKHIKTSFQFFVCYERKGDNLFNRGRTVYQSLERSTHGLASKWSGYGFKRYYEGEIESGFDVIDWTPERETFFKHIEEQFLKLNAQLDRFFGELNENKIKKLMTAFKGFSLEYKQDGEE